MNPSSIDEIMECDYEFDGDTLIITDEYGYQLRRDNYIKHQLRIKYGQHKKGYLEYRIAVDILSNINYQEFKYMINPKNLPRGYKTYHLDHIYTVYDGWINQVNIDIIASPCNLQMLPAQDNMDKGKNSEISMDELILKYADFLEK